ncbi:MAG: DUF4363 family protein [Clostridia bacterium]|nr:DUF4363 family protein [Clostridia bacterium]
MVKTLISALVAASFFLFGVIFEYHFVNRAFTDFDNRLEILYEKSESGTASVDDVLFLQRFWIKQKHGLHAVIPHAEIKEIDLWLSEAVRLTEQKKHDEAMQKVEVLRELCEQIPTNFKFRFENIF